MLVRMADFSGTGGGALPLSGRVALVTGGTNGIGKVTARELARKGAAVTIVGRNAEKTRAVADELGVAFILADLSEQAEVRRAAAEFRAGHPQLHILVNNAGGVFSPRQESVDGIEMTWALNHLAYFLLTRELLGALRAGPGARVVNVSSGAHEGGRLNWPDLEFKAGYRAFQAYSQSKLANIVFTRELARRLRGTGVTANALHPGFVSTGFGHNNGGWMTGALNLMRPLAISDEEGARTSIFLASSPLVEGVTGRYFTKEREVQPSPRALDDAAAARLWAVSEEMVGDA